MIESNRATKTWWQPSAMRWFVVGLLAWINCTVICHLLAEQTVYFWDMVGHWEQWIVFADKVLEWPAAAPALLLRSVNSMDYNYLPHVLTVPVALACGHGRLAYMLAILNMYLIPACLILSVLLLRFVAGMNRGAFPRAVFVTMVLLMPTWYTPLLKTSEPGGVGLYLVGLIMWLSRPGIFTERISPAKAISLASCAVLLMLTRRWYGAWVTGALLAVGVLGIWNCIRRAEGQRRRAWVSLFVNVGIVGVVGIGFTVMFFRPFLQRMLAGDYANAYAAYNVTGSIVGNLKQFCGELGWGYVWLALAGFALGMSRGDTTIRHWMMFSAMTLVVVTVLICRVATPNGGARYIFLPSLLLPIGYLVMSLVQKSRLSGILILLMVALNWIKVFPVYTPSWSSRENVILAGDECAPVVRSDLGRLRSLADCLKAVQLPGGTDEKIYVVASSLVLNDDILRRLDFPQVRNSAPGLMQTKSVDRRDGFPNDFFLASYVVVGVPAQYHLRPSEQDVVGLLVEPFATGTGIAQSYEKLYEFSLEQSVRAVVFKKITACDMDSLQKLKEGFAAHDGEEMAAELNIPVGLISKSTWGDVVGEIRAVGSNGIFMHPGNSTPTTVHMLVPDGYKGIGCVATFDNIEALQRKQGHVGEVALTIRRDGATVFHELVDYRKAVPISVNLDGAQEIAFEVANGMHGPGCDWFLLDDITFQSLAVPEVR